jgi:uncharacterized FAD-dependent dehydrogenase
MKKTLQLQLPPHVAFNEQLLKQEVALQFSLKEQDTLFIKPLKRSIDARSRNIKINLSVEAFVNETPEPFDFKPSYSNVTSSSKTVTIIGAGPAGLFAALRCLEAGLKPIIMERGKDVQSRRRDLAAINKLHLVNPESNYCFGEGGAGTYSDGKLYTRSTKRGDVEKILKTLVFHGASEEILVDAHPHIGTNKLPKIIAAIRQTILEFGGEVHFEHKLIDIRTEKNIVKEITVTDLKNNSDKSFPVENLILATGHSARDIYELLHKKNILIEAKPFAMGVRAEHPQELVDKLQYHCHNKIEVQEKRFYLPAASYSLVQQVAGRGVYSFCMCPGGIIAPCATSQQEIVTNGWSPSKRNNPYANSGIVVGFSLEDFEPYKKFGPLAGLQFQKELEHKAWKAGGETQTAPAQRLADFVNNKLSSDLPSCSYQPGIKSVMLKDVLGKLIGSSLAEGFKAFGKKMPGYLTNDAVIVGVESRTSTPVRIPRDKITLQHPQLKNLFPCGEGAGFAGGIISAAIDGERIIESVIA